MEQLTEALNRSLKIDDGAVDEKYSRYRQQGKEAAQRGNLELSLRLFRKAFDLRPSNKLQSRIQQLEMATQERTASEEEEEFVNVQQSGLMLYEGLYDQLYEHQRAGVAFLYGLHRDGRGGGILADDMGLGKTVQVIGFLSAMYDAELTKHTLLIMPTSLIKTWVSEFQRWTPGLRVKEFHGSSKSERNRNLERVQRGGGAIITTYQMVINNWQQLASCEQREFVWDYVILDEAHKIKTSSSKTAKSVSAVPSQHRLLLTGTPVQNNLREMWALFDFACQGSLLGSAKTFKTEYENPITRAREKDATPGEKALGLKISQNLTELIRPYFLRRTKAEVQNRKQLERRAREEEEVQQEKRDRGLEVPSLTRKTDLIVWTFLSDVQEKIYQQFISLDHIKELLTTTRSPLSELTVLKKLCDHPRLLSSRALAQLGLGGGNAGLQQDDLNPTPSGIEGVADETLIRESGKLNFLVSLMESLREEGSRTLVFSQSRKMLDIIQQVLANRKFRLLRVDGTITQLAERERRIRLFQTDTRYSVFLLTTQVGGVGLTLTAANRVVIFDPSWNPATDAQAVDRAYRIGQTSDVIIYRLVTCGTVEEKIYRRQVFKDSLTRQTTGDVKNPFRYFTKQELKELFTLGNARSSSTLLQLQSLHSASCGAGPELKRHLSALKDMEVFGVSRHDLLFSNEESEDSVQDEETCYINKRVQKAQELVQAESQLQSLVTDSIKTNTEPRQRYQHESAPGADEKAAPLPVAHSSPLAMVDLTRSESDDPEMLIADPGKVGKSRGVMNLSAQDIEQPADGAGLSINSQQSFIIMKRSINSNAPPLSQSGSSIVMLGTEWDSQKALLEAYSGSSEAQMEPESDSSKSLMVMGSFQGNFNLQLEDSAELLSEDKEEEDPEEPELSAGAGDFQLQMDITGEKVEESSHEDGFLYVKQQQFVSTPTDESISVPTRRKKRPQVLYNSEEEEELVLTPEEPVLACSSLADITNHMSSTPKTVLTNSATCRHSLNTSIASRRSLVELLLQDMEEEEEGCSSEEVDLRCRSGASGTGTDESVMQEAEPSGETRSEEEDEESEGQEEKQEQSFINDYTALELGSSERVDHCAPFKMPLPTLTSSNTDVKEPEACEETFDSLVHSGKRSLAEGRKQEALNLFLKAIDINAGDAEIQLQIIHLYRQLSQIQPYTHTHTHARTVHNE